jgi:hypothetical protein
MPECLTVNAGSVLQVDLRRFFRSLLIYYSQINLTFRAIYVELLTVLLNKLSINTQIDKYISLILYKKPSLKAGQQNKLASIPSKARDFTIFYYSKPVLGFTQPLSQWITNFFRRVRRPGREADPLPLSSAEIKNECSYASKHMSFHEFP